MRRLLLLAAVAMLTLWTRGGGAQPGSSGGTCARTSQAAERQIAQLEDAWNRAGTARDAAFFERLLAADFVATGGRTVRTKADYIAGIRDTTDGPRTRATLSETRVRLYGDVAVVSGLSSYAGTPPVRRRYTEVFACRAGRWQAVHGHYNTLRDTTAR
jgi:ketosteroid isomerase-like protein